MIHYSRVSDGLQPDIDAVEAKDLAHIFDRLQFHYMMNPLQQYHDDDLFLIYENLQIVFDEYS